MDDLHCITCGYLRNNVIHPFCDVCLLSWTKFFRRLSIDTLVKIYQELKVDAFGAATHLAYTDMREKAYINLVQCELHDRKMFYHSIMISGGNHVLS